MRLRPSSRSRLRAIARGSVLVGLASAALAGCGSSTTTASSPSTLATTTAAAAARPVTVFAAASLTEAFTDERSALAAAGSRLRVTFSFAGSQVLVQQVGQGAPADVVATADTKSMATLEKAGLVEAPQVFAHNRLEILVPPGNPKHVTALADLARGGLTVVLCDTTVPAGKYAAQALARAGLHVAPKSLEPDVKSAVRKVTSGEADATIVYVTDVAAAGKRAAGVVIPPASNLVATYPIAVVKGTPHHAAAEIFVDAIVHGSGQRALGARGFLGAGAS